MKRGAPSNRYPRQQKRPAYFDPELPVFARRDSSQSLRKQRASARLQIHRRHRTSRPVLRIIALVLPLALSIYYLQGRVNLSSLTSLDLSLFLPERSFTYSVETYDPPLAELEFPKLVLAPSPVVSHRIQKGESLSLIARKLGLPFADLQAIDASFRKFKREEGPRPVLKAGEKVHFSLDKLGGVRRFELPVSVGERFVIERKNPTEPYQAEMLSLPKTQKERTLVGLIDSSFAAAATKVGVPYDVVDDLVDLVGSRVSFYRDFQKGDRFAVIYKEKVLEDGTSVAPGPILAAVLQAGDREIFLVRYVGTDGKARYFDQTGKLIENSFLRYPLRFSRISSAYTDSRMHPVLKIRRPHHGVDFAAPTGTPVRSVADGTVVSAGRSGGAGIMIKIRHSDRYSTVYMHLSKLGKGIRKGAKVQRGQVIAAVGSTGLSTGPHLDFRFLDRGRYVNPLTVDLPILEKLKKGNSIDKTYLKRVMFTLNHYQGLELENSYWHQS